MNSWLVCDPNEIVARLEDVQRYASLRCLSAAQVLRAVARYTTQVEEALAELARLDQLKPQFRPAYTGPTVEEIRIEIDGGPWPLPRVVAGMRAFGECTYCSITYGGVRIFRYPYLTSAERDINHYFQALCLA